MTYRIVLTTAARKNLAALPKNVLGRVDARILSLADNPRPSGVAKLKGKKDFWRIRVGDYRVVYRIRDEMLVVVMIRISHRRDVYRNL